MNASMKNVVIVLLLCIVVFGTLAVAFMNSRHNTEKRDLLNQIATRDKTIEVSKNVYVKLTTDHEELKNLLDNSSNEVSALTEQLELQKQHVVALEQSIITWKHAYEGALNAHQVPVTVPPDVPKECVDSCLKLRTRVDFEKDFGHIVVNGYTVTNPAEGHVSVRQGRPLKLTLALTQGRDGSFKTFVTSSEDNVEVDLRVSSIDTSGFRPHWYEKVGFLGQVSIGSGLYSSVGISYDFGHVSVAPTYGYSSDLSSSMYGVALTWKPFAR